MPYPSVKYTLDDLFGSERKRVVFDLPCNIGYLAEKLNNSHFHYTADELIRNHTMYPLYENFVPPDVAKNIYLRMLGDSRQNLQSVLGLTASNVPMLQRFKFCRECNAESLTKDNDIYFNRVHQNQCVDVCHYHESPLIISKIEIKRNSQKGFVCLDKHDFHSVYQVEDLTGINTEHLMKIAKSFDYLLSGKFSCAFHQLRIRYLHLAKEYNLFKRDCIDVNRLKTEFIKFYGEKLLARVGSMVDYKVNNWLPAMFRQHRHLNHPVRHVLLMIFLAGDIQSFCGFVPDGSVKCHEPRGKGQSINKHSRVNWAVRDRETLSKVKMVVKWILTLQNPFMRLTVHSVCGKTDEKDRILKSLNKMPMTKEYLNSVAETHEQFQFRKVDSVVKTYGKMKMSERLIYEKAMIKKNRYKDVDCYIKQIAAESSRGKLLCP
jgi:hypothetical protein